MPERNTVMSMGTAAGKRGALGRAVRASNGDRAAAVLTGNLPYAMNDSAANGLERDEWALAEGY